MILRGIEFFVLILLLFIFSIAPQIQAQEKTTISVTPAIIEVASNPGESNQSLLVVRNSGNFALPISIKAQSFILNEQNSNNNTEAFDASKWIKVSNENYFFEGGETKKIPIQIDIPENASPGGHYAQLAIRGLTLESDSNSGNTAIVVPEISVGVFITVSGDIKESFEILSKNIFPIQKTPASSIKTILEVKNIGNVHNLVAPEIIYTDKDGNTKKIGMGSKVVLPGSIMKFEQEWEIPNQSGIYNAKVQFKYGNNQNNIATNKEKIFVTPPLVQLIFIALLSWTIIYLVEHRKNIKKAIRIIVKH